ncbi:hypothetical protein TSUKUMMB_07910 [Rhodococcus sp. no. 34]
MLPEPAKEPVSGSLAAALHVAEAAGPQGAQLAEFAREAFIKGMDQGALTLAAIMWVSAIVLGFWAPGRQRD